MIRFFRKNQLQDGGSATRDRGTKAGGKQLLASWHIGFPDTLLPWFNNAQWIQCGEDFRIKNSMAIACIRLVSPRQSRYEYIKCHSYPTYLIRSLGVRLAIPSQWPGVLCLLERERTNMVTDGLITNQSGNSTICLSSRADIFSPSCWTPHQTKEFPDHLFTLSIIYHTLMWSPCGLVLTITYSLFRYPIHHCWCYSFNGLELHVVCHQPLRLLHQLPGALCLILFVNLTVFLMVTRVLFTPRNVSAKKPPQCTKKDKILVTTAQIRGAFTVMVLLGVSWVFGAFAVGEARLIFQYIFCVANSLQGFLIFLVRCLQYPEARSAWYQLLKTGTFKKYRGMVPPGSWSWKLQFWPQQARTDIRRPLDWAART
ncbi:adhesion G-protein coupled receptor G4 [Caerostris extrusa]|uniref:Adhesion G-protein coupled receptor G4 n=1 Tax=Caerostris extrusa TaxID=172846 RepID=A0AAV4RB91_CAEEX|nr:adhesion G-protein coupled receptor G4 [Caerostris extrusa]